MNQPSVLTSTQLLNQTRKSMTDQEKKKYNQEYYQNNKPQLLGRSKARYKSKNRDPLNVIQLFKVKKTDHENQQEPKKNPRENGGTIFLTVFVSAMTFFLVSETAHFYASIDGTLSSGLFKAALLESAVFAFTLMKARNTATGILYKLLVFLIYAYSTWAISGSVIHNAFSQQKQIALEEKRAAELELEISKKIAHRDSFFQTNHKTLASRTDLALTALNQRLEKSRDILTKSPDISTIWNTLATLVILRVLIMISNLFCLKELARRYQKKVRTI
jgi:hypothetical protein